MNRKLNIDDLKLIVKDCVYIEKGVVYMSDTYYNDIFQIIENLQSKIDKAIEFVENHTDKLKTTRIPKIDFNYNELLDILKEDK